MAPEQLRCQLLEAHEHKMALMRASNAQGAQKAAVGSRLCGLEMSGNSDSARREVGYPTLDAISSAGSAGSLRN